MKHTISSNMLSPQSLLQLGGREKKLGDKGGVGGEGGGENLFIPTIRGEGKERYFGVEQMK